MSTHKWTNTNASPATLKEGQLVNRPYRAPDSRRAEGAIRAGLVVEPGTDAREQVKALAALPGADDDSIALHLASAAAPTWYAGADIDGAIGKGKIFPASVVTITCDASGDWDPTTAKVVGLDADGEEIEDTIAIATSTTGYSSRCFSQVLRVFFPTQTGAGGVAKVGTDPTYGMAVSPKDVGIAIYDRAYEQGSTAAVTYADKARIAVLHAGQIAAVTEDAVVVGDKVGVRMVLAGADVRGQLSKMPSQLPGSCTFALLTGARWKRAAAGDATSVVEIGG